MKTRRRYRRKSISKRRRRRSTKKKRRYRRKGTKKKRRRRRRRGGEGDPPKKRTLKRTHPRSVMSGLRGFVDPIKVDREVRSILQSYPSGMGAVQREFAPKLYASTMKKARQTAVEHVVDKENKPFKK